MPIARSATAQIIFEDLDINRLLNVLDVLAIGSRSSGDEYEAILAEHRLHCIGKPYVYPLTSQNISMGMEMIVDSDPAIRLRFCG